MKFYSGKMKSIIVILLLTSVFNSYAQHDTTNQKMSDPTNTVPKYAGIQKEGDSKFLLEVMEANREEIQMADLASQKSTDLNVNSVAATLKNDHQGLLNQLTELAQRKSVTIPQPDTVKEMADMKQLTDSKPADFNKNWIDVMIKNHQETLEKLQKAQSTVSDNDLRGWIKNTIPKVENHIAQLTALRQKVK